VQADGSVDLHSTAIGATLVSRGGGALVLAGGALLVRLSGKMRRRTALAILMAGGVPAVVATWSSMAHFVDPTPAMVRDLGLVTLALYAITASLVLPVALHRHNTFLGRGLVAGLMPLAAGQMALMSGVTSIYDNGFHIAVLLKWFAWILPACGLGIDFLNAYYERGMSGEKRFLRAVVDAIPHFIFARDENGRFTLVNSAVARFYDRRIDEIEGRLISELYDDAEQVAEWMKQDRDTLERGTEWTFPEEIGAVATGETIHLHSIKKPLHAEDGDNHQVLGVSIDVSDRISAERALAELLEAERTSAAILRTFVQATNTTLNESMTAVLGNVGAFTGAARCSIVRFGRDGGQAQRLFTWVDPSASPRPMLPPMRIESDVLVWTSRWFAMNAPVVAETAADLPGDAAGFVSAWGLPAAGGMLAMPITHRGRPFGFVVVDDRRSHRWRRDEIALLRNVGDLFVTVFDKLETERSLKEAMEAAQASSKAKTEFLANMSHEIRTPMNCVIGIADLLQEMDPTPQQQQYLDMIRQSGGSLLTVINDILDISKIEAGRFELDPVQTDLRALVEEVVGLIAFSAQTQGLEVICRQAPGVPEHGVIDGGRLRQVLTNLLNNASKFTHQGHIYLNVEPVGEDDGSVTLRFEVRDTGIGIPAAQVRKIFDKFTQAEAGTTRRFGGTGLGLAICQRLVNLMGGEIEVDSTPGVGSVFTFTVPVQDPQQRSVSVPAPDAGNLLVVTGHELSGEVLLEQVRHMGHHASVVLGAADALTMLAGNPSRGCGRWTSVLVDENLSAGDLQTIVDHCTALPSDDRPRVLLMTNVAGRSELMADLTGRVDGTLAKPVRPSHLASAVAGPGMALVFSTVKAPPADPAVVPASSSTAADGDRPRILLAEDNPFNQKVAVGMLQLLGCTVTVAGNGAEALDHLQRAHFDLVCMDCQMPEMDGYEATRRIRELPGDKGRIPVVAMTANALSGDRRACFQSGMDDFLSKPINKAMLSSMLTKFGFIEEPVG